MAAFMDDRAILDLRRRAEICIDQDCHGRDLFLPDVPTLVTQLHPGPVKIDTSLNITFLFETDPAYLQLHPSRKLHSVHSSRSIQSLRIVTFQHSPPGLDVILGVHDGKQILVRDRCLLLRDLILREISCRSNRRCAAVLVP